MSNDLQCLIIKKQWERLVEKFTPELVVQSLSFKEVMSLAYRLFLENYSDFPKIRDFALNLFFETRKHYASEWDKDWKNDILLSDLCRIGYKYDECYYCRMRAYKKFPDPPPVLLIALAGCYNVPRPRVTLDQAESLLQRAIQKEISYEAALQLRGIYMAKQDQAKVEYWTKIVEETERKNIRTDPCTPDIFKDKQI